METKTHVSGDKKRQQIRSIVGTMAPHIFISIGGMLVVKR